MRGLTVCLEGTMSIHMIRKNMLWLESLVLDTSLLTYKVESDMRMKFSPIKIKIEDSQCSLSHLVDSYKVFYVVIQEIPRVLEGL